MSTVLPIDADSENTWPEALLRGLDAHRQTIADFQLERGLLQRWRDRLDPPCSPRSNRSRLTSSTNSGTPPVRIISRKPALTEAAIEWWGKAGRRSLERSALVEAIEHARDPAILDMPNSRG